MGPKSFSPLESIKVNRGHMFVFGAKFQQLLEAICTEEHFKGFKRLFMAGGP